MSRFTPGVEYNRTQLHEDAKQFGKPGNAMAGIAVVAGELCIFWNPYKKLYANQWIEEPSEFWYSGEGASGAMDDTAGNRHLREAETSGAAIQVFYKIAATGSRWLCLGAYRVVTSEPGVSVGSDHALRTDVRFRLLADVDLPDPISLPVIAAASAPELPSEADLWAAQEQEVTKNGGRRRRAPVNQRAKRQSSPLKTAYVVRRAIDFGGTCESCGEHPGWVRDNGQPHFQAHHLIADIDLVDWIAAVCGTCHDRLHHGQDREARASLTRELVRSRQQALHRRTYSKEQALELPGVTLGA